MSRQQAIQAVEAYFDDGRFFTDLNERVRIKSESQNPEKIAELHRYLHEIIVPQLEALGFRWQLVDNPAATEHEKAWPFLLAERIEDPAALTVLTYGHGDVVRGYDSQWKAGLSPWEVVVQGDRWYGRGTADNKGQHTINLAALTQVLEQRQGKLGFNVKIILEMGEESGSPGLGAVCATYKEQLQADVFIASDGPRLGADHPTVFLGSRGSFNFDLTVRLRDSGHHSGNWGGLLSNAGTRLAHAWTSMVDSKGRILVPGLLPDSLPQSVRDALKDISVGGGLNDPEVDPQWGEPGLTPTERVFGWNTLEMLACKTGNPEAPVNAIPGLASAHCQIRYVVGSDSHHFIEHIRAHLDQHGFTDVEAVAHGMTQMEATRLDPQDPWVQWALSSLAQTTGKTPVLLPNLGGSLPNDVFAHILGLPTLWVPHSYPACSQHAPNEHVLAPVCREALQIMAGLFWDLAEQGESIRQQRQQ